MAMEYRWLVTDPRAKRATMEDVYSLLSVGFVKGTSGFLKAGGGEQKGGGMINREVRVGFTHVSVARFSVPFSGDVGSTVTFLDATGRSKLGGLILLMA